MDFPPLVWVTLPALWNVWMLDAGQERMLDTMNVITLSVWILFSFKRGADFLVVICKLI